MNELPLNYSRPTTKGAMANANSDRPPASMPARPPLAALCLLGLLLGAAEVLLLGAPSVPPWTPLAAVLLFEPAAAERN